MFAYCGNNPANNVDPAGMWTVSFSFGGDFTFFFFGMSISIGIAFDDDANVAIQWSYSQPNYVNDHETYHYGLADAGVGFSMQVTDDDTIYNLEGPASYAGFTAGGGFYGGIDMVYSGLEGMDDHSAETNPNGIQATFGFGVGLDVHFKQTQTKTVIILN